MRARDKSYVWLIERGWGGSYVSVRRGQQGVRDLATRIGKRYGPDSDVVIKASITNSASHEIKIINRISHEVRQKFAGCQTLLESSTSETVVPVLLETHDYTPRETEWRRNEHVDK